MGLPKDLPIGLPVPAELGAGTGGGPAAPPASFQGPCLVLLSQKKRLIQKVAGEVLSESVTG
jgi:hypothetical protein